MKNLARLSVTLLVVGTVVGSAWANKACRRSEPVTIMVSPSVLVLHSSCDQITVHSNVPFSSVTNPTVVVNHVTITDARFWADDCGDLVARVSLGTLFDVVVLRASVLEITLTGSSDGTKFEATESIPVRE